MTGLFVVFGYCWGAVVLHGTLGNKLDGEPATSSYDVEAVLGKLAKLPCDLQPAIANDRIHIVIWFKGVRNRSDPDAKEKLIPIYSLDARDKPIEGGTEWKDVNILGDRASFRYKNQPATLMLNTVREDDEAVYFCRVDFRQTPTKNIKVNLTVIVPPEKLKIIEGANSNHIRDYKLGPFNEGSSVNITCEATGGEWYISERGSKYRFYSFVAKKKGRPLPKVTWWLENALLDESMDYVYTDSDKPEFDHKTGKVRNVLHIEKVDRKSLTMVYTCQATNSRLVHPISSTIMLDVNLKPLWVKMLNKEKALSAGHTSELECEVVGARPEPTITWWKGSVQMKNTREVKSQDGNITTSILTFVPTVEDRGKYLSCRGEQPLIQDSGIEDGWKLNIYHVPLVSLELGNNLNGSIIKEGTDVYFECNIKSNPWVYKISWRHNGQQLYNNLAVGIIVSNQSLVLQAITTARAGHYTCVGHNQEGEGESNPVLLDVKFAPICRPGQIQTFAVAKHETLKISCDLEANPIEVEFFWKFNESQDIKEITSITVYNEKTTSIAMLKPSSDKDYGALSCWGRNAIGTQTQPCIYKITQAEEPESPTNCTVSNQTSDTIAIECVEGGDGGTTQDFRMEVYETQYGKLLKNVTAKTSPIFTVTGLESGAQFDIVVYAANKKGRSPSTYLTAFTLKAAEKRTAFTPILYQLTPELVILLGVVATLILIAIVIVIVIRLRGGGSRHDSDARIATSGRKYESRQNSDKTSTERLNKDLNDSFDSLDEKNPDIIPQDNTDDEYQNEEMAFERLNNVPLVKPFNSQTKNGNYPKTHPDEITYAELSLARQDHQAVALNHPIRYHHEPTVYAQLDLQRISQQRRYQTMQQQHHHHPRLSSYDQLTIEPTIGFDTPLLPPNNVRQAEKHASPAREAQNATSMTATLPRSVRATKF